MPDQPEDPIHYDMKIPPEKHPSPPGNDTSSSESEDKTQPADTSKDTNVVRRGEDSQSEDHHG